MIMDALMERFGFQWMILTLCAGVSFFQFFFEENRQLNDSSEFELVKKAKGIELYERWYPMESGKLTREIKAVCTIKTSLESAIALLWNEEKGVDWNNGTNAYKVIPQKGNQWLCYIQYDLPWPLDDQDCVLLNTPNPISKDLVFVHFNTIEHPSFPEKEQVSRIPFVKGKWVFQQKEGGIRAEYYITTTPSSILPRQVTDPIIRHNLISTLDRYRNLLEN